VVRGDLTARSSKPFSSLSREALIEPPSICPNAGSIRSGDACTARSVSRGPYGEHVCARRLEPINSDLLNAAEATAIDVLVTTDKNLRYQQNLTVRKIAIIVLLKQQWPDLRRNVHLVVAALDVLSEVALRHEPGTQAQGDR